MYITDTDYQLVIGDSALKIISQANADVRTSAENEAIEEISSYLRPTYDVATIFAATGSSRNAQLVMYCCDIALYHMASSMPQRIGTEVRKERYDRAIKWLEGVQSGKIVPDLPIITADDGTPQYSPIRYNCQEKQHNNW